MPPKKQSKPETTPEAELANLRSLMEKMMIGMSELREEVGKIREKVDRIPEMPPEIMEEKKEEEEEEKVEEMESEYPKVALDSDVIMDPSVDPMEKIIDSSSHGKVIQYLYERPGVFLDERESIRTRQHIIDQNENRKRMAELAVEVEWINRKLATIKDNTLFMKEGEEESQHERKLNKQQKKALALFNQLTKIDEDMNRVLDELKEPPMPDPVVTVDEMLKVLEKWGGESAEDPASIPISLRFTPIPDDTPIQTAIVGCHWALVQEDSAIEYLQVNLHIESELRLFSRILEFDLQLEDLTLKNPMIRHFNTHFFNPHAGQFDILTCIDFGTTCSIVDNKIYTHNYISDVPGQEDVEKVVRYIEKGLLVMTYEMRGVTCARRFARVKLY